MSFLQKSCAHTDLPHGGETAQAEASWDSDGEE